MDSFRAEYRLFSFSVGLIISLLTFIILINKALKIYLDWLSYTAFVWNGAIFFIAKINVKKTVPCRRFEQFDTGH